MTPAYKRANPSVCNSNLSSFRSLRTLPELYSMTRTTGWLNASSRTAEGEPQRRCCLLASCLKRAKWGVSLSQIRLWQGTAHRSGSRGLLGWSRRCCSTCRASSSSLGCWQWGSRYAAFRGHLRQSNGLGSYRVFRGFFGFGFFFFLFILDMSSWAWLCSNIDQEG